MTNAQLPSKFLERIATPLLESLKTFLERTVTLLLQSLKTPFIFNKTLSRTVHAPLWYNLFVEENMKLTLQLPKWLE